ncbi:MAG: type I methionyl aminopeptidase [Thermodesulfobacteriota bacterium]|nr:type I methionyl aminopeptidase [Thermodesulfobacteriota bacterium]
MVTLKLPAEIERLRENNRIVAYILEKLKEKVKPGVTTLQLNRQAEDLVRKKGVKAAFKGYQGYPYALCTSVNEEVVHGMPSGRELQEGDIISIDFGVFHQGYYGDAAITVPVGRISPEAQLLIKVTEASLYDAINQARAGNRLGDISAAVQRRVEAAGFSVVRDYVGHGIGKQLHEEPQIPNYGTAGKGIELKAGMVLAIEPMVNAGACEVAVRENGWTVVTRDHKYSAHYEHSVAITEDGPCILSQLRGKPFDQ